MPTKILAIDDSKTMRLAIKITFASEDADVTSVSKGSEAVARAKQMGADVVLVDAKLADGEPSGYDVCRALKEDASTSSIPVLLLVSNQTGVDQGKLRSVGGDGYVAKPFDTQELIDKVGQAMGRAVKPAAAAGRAAAHRPAARAQPAPAAQAPVKHAPGMGRQAPARPAAQPSVKVAPAPARAAARPAAAATGDVNIPIAIPIPFTAADAPTPGILKRLQDASPQPGAQVAGLDPKVAEALVLLSREVIEQIVWEVVPDLAEEILKRHAQARSA